MYWKPGKLGTIRTPRRRCRIGRQALGKTSGYVTTAEPPMTTETSTVLQPANKHRLEVRLRAFGRRREWQ